ncbi:MAG: hypothetical protein QOG15_1398 [Solirubrobacteraceae bacterium]|nr:hypothetical protein [Solirubrobacteraceae bacterium]
MPSAMSSTQKTTTDASRRPGMATSEAIITIHETHSPPASRHRGYRFSGGVL